MANEPELPEEFAAVEEQTEEIHFEEYIKAVLKRWRLIAICVAITLTGAALYSILSPRLYKADVIVDIERDLGNPLDISSTPIATYAFGPEFLATQARLMRTSEIAERVAKRLNLGQNREFLPAPEKPLKPEQELARAAGEVKKNLSAKPVREVGVTTRDTYLVQLSAVAPAPALAADIANAAAEEYISWNLESRYGIAGRASGYLAQQIEQTKRELDAKNQELLAYGKQKDILGTDPQNNLNLQKNEADYTAAVAERVAKEAHYRDVQNASADSLADTLAGGLVTQLRADQARLEREYAEKLNLFKPEWPAMRQLKAQIDNGREHLRSVIGETVTKARETARNDYLSALRREESLKSGLKSQRSEAMKLTGDIVTYNNLKTEVDTKRTLLDTLLKRQAEVEVMSRLGRQRESNIRIAERARRPRIPYRPSYVLNGLVALVAGGVVGVGLALVREYLDRSLRTPEQVEQHLRLPSLGVIPSLGAVAGKRYGYTYGGKPRRKRSGESGDEDPSIELLPHRNPRSLIAERYRAFRTALLLSRAGGVRSIVITSSLSKEGKTATAVNLAIVLSQLGKRVLLVDADLHKPRLHEIFRISNRVGLVSVLAENLKPDDAIVDSGVPDVFVIPSGPSSPNPSGLLFSESMSHFLDFGCVTFDYVILDTPPVEAVADALVLGHQTDGVVLCVEGGKTPRGLVAGVRDRLLRSNVRILGVLINNLSEEPSGYGASDYGVYYGDEKQYGEEERTASAIRIL